SLRTHRIGVRHGGRPASAVRLEGGRPRLRRGGVCRRGPHRRARALPERRRVRRRDRHRVGARRRASGREPVGSDRAGRDAPWRRGLRRDRAGWLTPRGHAAGLGGRMVKRLIVVLAAAGLAATAPFAQELRKPDVVYVPTPQPVVEAMLEMAKVTASDVVYDLGCGDGRIPITAAKKYGARGVGIDIDPQRIAEANENAKVEGVTDKVKFLNQDLFTSDFSEATVVTLYLLPTLNLKLMPQLKALKPGTRIVSHAFDMGSAWPPEAKQEVAGKTIYYWTIK